MSGLMMKYFILKPAGDNIYSAASRQAMRAYARTIEVDNPEMSTELKAWADREALAVTDGKEQEREYTHDMMKDRIAELEAQLSDIVQALDEQMIVTHLGVFNLGDNAKEAIDKLMLWSQGVGESFANEALANCQLAECQRELADMTQAVGLLTTLHPTMEIDTKDPIGMAKQIEAHVSDCQRERDALEKELLEERASYEAERQRLRDALEAILNINWGYDGDCGAARIAEQALEKET